MNLVEYGVGSVLCALFISVIVLASGAAHDTSLTTSQVDVGNAIGKFSQFNKSSGELTDIGKTPDEGALDETASYLNIGQTVNSVGDFLKMALVQYINMGATLVEANVPPILAYAIWWFWQISAWASIGGFIITRLNK